ncbi:hypothetical protein CALVIDRAFT_431576 [Calocera viscosa TUFC12733]|uniref:Uncharacterized protein n=1 Tax=Calocera viscosa (strain TUFC12733) TaxID=1330018 RepID=A0A167FZU2_CALVF|nr:hypothetical protein CALVIDRAFT_431576 [Calocera viscosa TUFC12733]
MKDPDSFHDPLVDVLQQEKARKKARGRGRSSMSRGRESEEGEKASLISLLQTRNCSCCFFLVTYPSIREKRKRLLNSPVTRTGTSCDKNSSSSISSIPRARQEDRRALRAAGAAKENGDEKEEADKVCELWTVLTATGSECQDNADYEACVRADSINLYSGSLLQKPRPPIQGRNRVAFPAKRCRQGPRPCDEAFRAPNTFPDAHGL